MYWVKFIIVDLCEGLCWSCVIQYENWWNVVYSGSEGSISFLLVEASVLIRGLKLPSILAGKRDQGVVAPFQSWLENYRRLQPSAGRCLCTDKSLHQYNIVRNFPYNKYWRQRWHQQWFSPKLGFHLKSWCSCVFLLCDDLFCCYCTYLLIKKQMHDW